ncbi:MAG: NAD(P)-dependent oxidoreductase [Gammaproteobacteria bacterium]|nr:MAG: NAD(P)-dependent oxidoreductase [Gammaproteobacteria bacterium]
MTAHITVFGLGEAGSLIGADLAQAGVAVNGFDPAPVPTPPGVARFDDPRTAVVGADVVIALTAAADARTALTQALGQIPPHALYADFSTSTAAAKQGLAGLAKGRGLAFVDVALMSTVPGKGLRTPALAAGKGAAEFVRRFSALGMPVTAVSEKPGDAATRKLLRSVAIKGLASVVIEAMRAAERAGCADWLWENLAEEITRADEAFLSRLVRGTGIHAVRRLHEMEASRELLLDLGVDPVMTRATVENLRRAPEEGLPEIPILPD